MIQCKTEQQNDSLWQSSSVPNLIRYKPTGVYFARVRIGGKLIRKSLKTNLLSVARPRLNELIREERAKIESGHRMAFGKMMFEELAELYLAKLDGNMELKPRTRAYRRECLQALRKTWASIDAMPVRKFTRAAVEDWAMRLRKDGTQFKPNGSQTVHQGISPSRFNNTVGTLRMILDTAVEMGILYANPTQRIKRAKDRKKEVMLPSVEQFIEFVGIIDKSGAGQAHDCANMTKFLAFSGCRLSEALNSQWSDIDFENEMFTIRGDPITGTKNWEIRTIPMNDELIALLKKMREQRHNEPLSTPILRVRECQKSMNRAAKILNITRITHHDLRKLFATRAIESGVDVPTVSRWLGHKDGGALLMRTYGHLREKHSKEQIKKVNFGFLPANEIAVSQSQQVVTA